MRRRAFTLVELLVVIGILALLLAILLPSLQQARNYTRGSVCAAHLKDMGLALQSYTDENRGYFPGHAAQSATVLRAYVAWAPRIRKYAPDTDLFFCPSLDNDAARWNPVMNWTGEDVTWLGYAPGERPLMGPQNFPPAPREYFSYGYNAWGIWVFTVPHLGLGARVGEGEWGELRESRVRAPSDMITIADSVSDGGWDTWITPVSSSSWPGVRHRLGANVLFADSHVDLRLQEALVKRNDDNSRRRWNNDNLTHHEYWPPIE